MKRKPNTKRNGKNFSKKEELAVWNKACLTDDFNVRLDICGLEIHFDKYGDTSSGYGWEIDHIKPVSKGGGDEFDNLQPLYWKTNRQKGDKWPISPTDYCGQSAE